MGGVNGGPGLGVPEHVGMASTTGSGSVTIQRKHVVNEIRGSVLKGGGELSYRKPCLPKMA